MNRTSSAFTVVELLVVVIVIAVLATITVLSYSAIQKQSRDNDRSSSAKIIADALEEYYEQNGEYPNCYKLTNSDVLSIKSSVMSDPLSSSDDSSLRCNDIEDSPSEYFFSFLGDDSTECSNLPDGFCSRWELKYRNESDNSISKIESRRSSGTIATTPPNFNGIAKPTGVDIAASVSGNQAIGDASAGSCQPSTSIEHQIRNAATSTSSSGAWSAWQSGQNLTVSASEGWQYTFEQRARCTSGGNHSEWASSSQASAIRPITSKPTTPNMSASHTSAVVTWSYQAPSNCPTGTTAQYDRRSAGDWGYQGNWSGAYSATTINWADNGQGFEYTMDLKARCHTIFSDGPWTSASSKSHVRPIDTPGKATNFTYQVSTDRTTSHYGWSPPTCGPGTTHHMYFDLYTGDQNPDDGVSNMGWPPNSSKGWMASPSWINVGVGNYNGINVTMDDPPDNLIPPNYDEQMKIMYRCVNQTTNRTSSWGPVAISPMFKS